MRRQKHSKKRVCNKLCIFKASTLWANAFYNSKCPYVYLSVCSLIEVPFKRLLPPLPKIGCPKFLKIQNPWGKVMERSGLTFEHLLFGSGLKSPRKKKIFFADFALQNMVETTLPDGLETSGRRVYR